MTETAVTDMSYTDHIHLAEALTVYAQKRNWCYSPSGRLDSRDAYILTVHAKGIAEDSGLDPDGVNERALISALLKRGWEQFIGPDYDRGGSEFRYRPPGCGSADIN